MDLVLPMRSLSTRGLRFGFVLVVVLLSSGAMFSVLSARRAAEHIDRLVTASLERERLIGLMRLDAALLIQAAGDHISAPSDEVRQSAARAMDVILEEIQDTSERYATDLPGGEAALWVRLGEVSARLVNTVDVTVKASNRREAERARRHLEEEAKPISFELDDIASQLAEKNAQDTRRLLAELQAMRVETSQLGAAVVALALGLSLLVAFQVTRMLREQEHTIAGQLSELNRRNAELDAFASRVAHDLVAPLAPLRGSLTLARRQSPDPAVKELLALAESSTARMSELVDGLLRFCRAGRPSENACGALDVAVSTILLEQSQVAAAAGVRLERQLDERVSVPVPLNLLQSIAQNLLSNAVKYTAGTVNAEVKVLVRGGVNEALLEVTDNGPGMSDVVVQQLFRPFFRAPEVRGLPGFGLGLATTRRLVEAHGGRLDVRSAPGRGTRVTVSFPCVMPRAAPVATARAVEA